MQKLSFFRIPDLFLFISLTVIPLYVLFHQTRFFPAKPVAVVEVAGVVRYTIPLDKERQVILNDWNPPVVLEVKPGKIRILKNDCPQHICQHTGYITGTGQSIICVPKKILIYLKNVNGRDKDQQVTTVTG